MLAITLINPNPDITLRHKVPSPGVYDLSPVVQVEMMKHAYKNSSNRRTASQLARERASETAHRHQIWKKSPAIKTVFPELKREAIKRMRERPVSKELVKDIAADLNLSISRLYAWLKQNT